MAMLFVILHLLIASITLSGARGNLPTVPELESVKSNLATTTLDIFDTGNFSTTRLTVESDSGAPPRPLLIITPTEEGTYPVLLFHHGTSLLNTFYTDLLNTFYTDLLNHTSTHGYIVVAPQYYEWLPPTGPDELELAASVANWLLTGLQEVLPGNVEGNLDNLALAGHSRGGMMAFALALGKSETPLQVNISALIGVDPVAGGGENEQLKPEILTYVPHSFNLSIPVTVIGTGLGNETRYFLAPSCAPNGVNHVEFYSECKAPSTHFVTTEYGHMDMLDDHLSGIQGVIADLLCAYGKGSKDPMRKTIGGIMVAFLRAYFGGDDGDYMTILEDPTVAPVRLYPAESYGVPTSYAEF